MNKYKVMNENYFDDFTLRKTGLLFTDSDEKSVIDLISNLSYYYLELDGSTPCEFNEIANSTTTELFVCTKKLPPPIDVSKLTEQQQMDLIYDERYMTTIDDYEKVNIEEKEFFNYIKCHSSSFYKDCNRFSFSSLSYSVVKIESEVV